MIVAGIDVGSLSTKALIMSENQVLAWAVILTTPDSPGTAKQVLQKALELCKTAPDQLNYVVATGYGRIRVPFANRHVTEISCHARGTVWAFPNVRTILDMGGQDCKLITCDEAGKVKNFVLNDKCAAGTGRYLERIARNLGVPLGEIGPMSLQIVDKPVAIDSFCAVFAERDILFMRQQGKAINDILAGAHEALVRRILSLIERVGLQPDLSISGGIAKNTGVVTRIEKTLNAKAHIWKDPQVIGALGAALFAGAAAQKQAGS
jgi:predicted CoA-substrate-specific enzyme activase